jgi:N-acetylglutamate synthase-like GNAT family acetyltransferase
MDDEKWIIEKKIRFSTASESDIPEIIQFIHKYFLPDEPINRNINTAEGEGWLDCYIRNIVDDTFIKNPILNIEIAPACTIARSTVDNSMLGCRLGEIVSRQNGKDDSIPPILWIQHLPSFFPIPKKLVDTVNAVQLMRDISYSKTHAFKELTDCDKIYFATKVCVSPKARGCGLGSELVKRGYHIAKQTGCGYTYVFASSLYSQRIFHKLGNCKVLHEAQYEDYKYDRKGRPFLIDPQEHKLLQVLAICHLNE